MLKTCKRCSKSFYAAHGNQGVCGTCKAGRPTTLRRGVTRTFGVRHRARCWGEFTAVAEHQRFCSPRCRWLARRRDEAKYARPEHRGARRRLAPIVAQGWVRCARGAACKRAEFLDSELVGGFIAPGEAWHLGHADGESAGGPEHVACNTGAPSRLRARAQRW